MEQDNTNNHLSSDLLSEYVNLPDLLSDKEKTGISTHLAECTLCSDSFNRIFDEIFEQNVNKNSVTLFKQPDDEGGENAVFRSADSLVEVELTQLGPAEYNLRFTSLPSWLKNEKAALNADSVNIVRMLAVDTTTMYLISSVNELMKQGSLELISLKAPVVISELKKSGRTIRDKNYFRYAALVIILSAVGIFIYYTLRTGEKLQIQDEPAGITNDVTPGQNSVNKTDSTSKTAPEKVENVSPTNSDVGGNVFAENGKLEGFISSSNKINPGVEIISPSGGTEVKMPVRFEWMTSKKNITLKFVILTNREIPVYERLISGRELTLDTKLNPALYYWKLESSDSTEAMSKFIIR
jgi:hypothetical protein